MRRRDPGDDQADQQAEGVGDDVTLATLDLFARVVAANTAAFRGLDALTIDDAGRRAGLPASGLARGGDKMMVDRHPQPAVAPRIEGPLHRRWRRKVIGSNDQGQPLAAI